MSATLRTLGDCVTLASGGTPSKGKPELWEGLVPWASGKDLKGIRLFDTQDHVSEKAIGRGTRLTESGTILLLVRGMGLLKDAPLAMLQRPMAFNQDLKAISARPGIDQKWLLYWLVRHKPSLMSLASEAAHGTKRLETDRLLALPILVPSLGDQESVGALLSAYDDLIEVNQRRIAILVEIAQRLFSEWFVRFRFPGYESGRLIASEFGPLPERWGWAELSELCDAKAGIQTGPFGSQLHQEDYTSEGVPVVMPKNMANLRISTEGIARIPREKAAALDRHLLREGDTVYGRRGDIGRRAFVARDEAGWLCGTGCLRIRPNVERVAPRYLFDALGLAVTEGSIKGRAQGATMLNLSAGVMKTVPVLVPPREVQNRYCDLALPLYELSSSLCSVNAILSETRDVLIPKLVSGEIEVGADGAWEDAA